MATVVQSRTTSCKASVTLVPPVLCAHKLTMAGTSVLRRPGATAAVVALGIASLLLASGTTATRATATSTGASINTATTTNLTNTPHGSSIADLALSTWHGAPVAITSWCFSDSHGTEHEVLMMHDAATGANLTAISYPWSSPAQPESGCDPSAVLALNETHIYWSNGYDGNGKDDAALILVEAANTTTLASGAPAPTFSVASGVRGQWVLDSGLQVLFPGMAATALTTDVDSDNNFLWSVDLDSPTLARSVASTQPDFCAMMNARTCDTESNFDISSDGSKLVAGVIGEYYNYRTYMGVTVAVNANAGTAKAPQYAPKSLVETPTIGSPFVGFWPGNSTHGWVFGRNFPLDPYAFMLWEWDFNATAPHMVPGSHRVQLAAVIDEPHTDYGARPVATKDALWVSIYNGGTSRWELIAVPFRRDPVTGSVLGFVDSASVARVEARVGLLRTTVASAESNTVFGWSGSTVVTTYTLQQS